MPWSPSSSSSAPRPGRATRARRPPSTGRALAAFGAATTSRRRRTTPGEQRRRPRRACRRGWRLEASPSRRRGCRRGSRAAAGSGRSARGRRRCRARACSSATLATTSRERGSPVISDVAPIASPWRSFPARRSSAKNDSAGRVSERRDARLHEPVDDQEHALARLALAADDSAGLEGAEAHDATRSPATRRSRPSNSGAVASVSTGTSTPSNELARRRSRAPPQRAPERDARRAGLLQGLPVGLAGGQQGKLCHHDDRVRDLVAGDSRPGEAHDRRRMDVASSRGRRRTPSRPRPCAGAGRRSRRPAPRRDASSRKFSTSAGNTLKPPTWMTSFARPADPHPALGVDRRRGRRSGTTPRRRPPRSGRGADSSPA